MARPRPSRAPAIQPARLSSQLRARKRRPATAHRICALWWSMRPGRNCASADGRGRSPERGRRLRPSGPARPLRLARNDRGPARRTAAPARRCGSQAPPRRGPAAARRRADQHGERRIDQPRPVRDERLGRADAGQRGVEPGRAGEKLAHGDEPHRVVGVAQPVGERRPGAGKRGDDEEGGGEQRPGQRRGGPSRRARATAAARPVAKPASTSPLPQRNGAATLRDAP